MGLLVVLSGDSRNSVESGRRSEHQTYSNTIMSISLCPTDTYLNHNNSVSQLLNGAKSKLQDIARGQRCAPSTAIAWC